VAIKKTDVGEDLQVTKRGGCESNSQNVELSQMMEVEYVTKYSHRTWPILSLRSLKTKPTTHPYTN
jgi:hypothetical protein